jgi:hypothetical protein
MAYPATKTNAQDGTTGIIASHLNNLEDYVGVTGSADSASLTYKLSNTTSGHDHDGADSKKVLVTNLDVSGLTALRLLRVNAGATAAEGVAGPTGAIVGTTDTQVLTGKTISADDNTISGIAASSFVVSNGSGNIDGSAAQKAIPAGAVVGTTDTQTLTNKRVTPRVNTVASSATPSINLNTTDLFTITALATNITSMTTGLSGTPTDGQVLTIRIKDNGTARSITWGVLFASRGATLPTTTVMNKYLYVGFIYNEIASAFDCVAVSQEV